MTTNNYRIQFWDDTHYCFLDVRVTYNMNATMAPVILERSINCISGVCGTEDLAEFSTVHMTLCDMTSGSNLYACNSTGQSPGSGCGGSVPGWYEDSMYNSGTNNINIGTAKPQYVSGCWQGAFDATWVSSAGT